MVVTSTYCTSKYFAEPRIEGTFIKQLEMPEHNDIFHTVTHTQTKQLPHYYYFFFFKSPHVVLLEKGKSDNQVAFSSLTKK